MSNSPENIREKLVQLRGKPANHITHAVKRMSGSNDGSMADGLIALVDAFEKDKQNSVISVKKSYGAGGLIIGVVSTALAVTGIYIYNKKRKKPVPQAELSEIEKILDDEIVLANEEEIHQDIPE